MLEEVHCTVQLYDKQFCYTTPAEHSVLSLWKKVDSYITKAYLIWKTEKNQGKYLISTKDPCDPYECSTNLDSITPFYASYKKKKYTDVTLCFINPPHNLILQSSDDAPLDTFVTIVSLMSCRTWYSLYNYLTDVRSSNFTLRNTKIKPRKYPPSKGFPKTTEELILCKLKIMELDPQIILKLHNLKILNLSNNQISYLPKEVGTLPHLEKLFLSQNRLGNTCSEIRKWEWMEQTVISQRLKELDMSNNNLTELPLQIGKLQSLIYLNVSQNLLTKLPQIIGTLQHLARLQVGTNRLVYLPGSMRGMEIQYFLAPNNPFISLKGINYLKPIIFKVSSLFDLAAKAVKKYRIPYNNVPPIWVRYLDNAKFCCICKNPCFHSDITLFKTFAHKSHQSIIVGAIPVTFNNELITAHNAVVFKCYFCSSQCYRYLLRRQFLRD